MKRETTPFAVELTVGVDDIPEGGGCGFCKSGKMQKTLLTYKSGTSPPIATDMLPGYRCDNCGIEEISGLGILELALNAKEVLLDNGYDQLAIVFDEMIRNELEMMDY